MTRLLSIPNVIMLSILAVLAYFAYSNLKSHGKFSSNSTEVTVIVPNPLSSNAIKGKQYFDENCAACHGANASGGTDSAPPLIHIIYEPSHHGDASFHRAVEKGVPSHHWQFGNMPPIENVSHRQVSYIIAYVRELQRANGIN